MKASDFLQKLHSDLEIKSIPGLEQTTVFRDIEEFDSMAFLTIIAFVDEHFGKKISAKELISVGTVADLIKCIGTENFAD